ncbi:piRNA biogenesis protein EXD1 isoform X1 [Meleagris gallopavo]|uniref:Exonuclease 3'-5' domain containing 1 n=1 Tax=Meleagris gallopavo TaxID=9103 RepID=G1NF98_MELGA|nr:piRNA biogenesis protein EXD1 isoform X1 [Meleagris gallopavo]
MAISFQRLEAALDKSVKLTLTCGVFQGVLQHVSAGRDLLLHSVKNLETGRSSPGVKVFYSQEIVNVELLDEPDSQKRIAVLSECTSAVEENKGADMGTAQGGLGNSPCVSLERQLRALNNMNSLPGKEEEEKVEYTVVNCFQEKFGPAVLHLKQQDVISVVGEGVNLCRNGKLSWLQMATKSHIFLFDIFLLGPQAFRNGLQTVLEDKNILKVMHDCRWISDCLFHQYNVLLDNVFDTQVADVLQFSVATGGFFPHCTCTLQECLMQHLKIPSKWKTLMKHEQQMALENPDMWFLRPFPASLFQVLALKAMYLLLLRSSLMDNFMADLTAVVHAYLNTSQNGSEDHLGSLKDRNTMIWRKARRGAFAVTPARKPELTPTCMELPKELRELADIQKLRREKAVKEYRISEDGLLIRPVIELNERNPQKEETH